MTQQCQYVKPDSEPCQAKPRIGSSFCYFHDPATASLRTESQRAGGRARRAKTLPAAVADVDLETPRDIRSLLTETISQVRRGDLDTKVATTIGYLASMVLKSLVGVELQERVEHLERLVQASPQGSLDFRSFEPPEPSAKGERSDNEEDA